MIVEEAVLIKADIGRVWKTFTNLTCWAGWNTVATNAASPSNNLEQGKTFTFCIRPFSRPIVIEPKVKESVYQEKVVWSGSKFGISSRHEFLFQQVTNAVLVTSRENFSGLPLLLGGRLLIARVSRDLVVQMLQQLKKACERERHR